MFLFGKCFFFLNKRVWFTIVFFTSLRASQRVSFLLVIDFLLPFAYFVPFEVIENRVTKANPNILMEILKRLDFLKRLSLSKMHTQIVLKSLVSYQGK